MFQESAKCELEKRETMKKAMRKVKKRMARNCAGCGALKVSMKKCSRCTAVRYCSKECQRSHWKTHKKECKEMEDTVKILPDLFKLFKMYQKRLAVDGPQMLRHQGDRVGIHVTDLRSQSLENAMVSTFYTRAMVDEKANSSTSGWHKAVMALDHAKNRYPREYKTVTGGLIGVDGDFLFGTSVGLCLK